MNTDFVKAILYVYPAMGALIEAARTAAENKALLSYRSRFNAMHDLEEVVEEIFLAERLGSLKKSTEEALVRLNKEELFLLEYRYFRRKKALAKFGEEIPCSERNYFRKQEKLLRKIAARFSASGITEEYFLKAFKNSVCLMKVYGAIKNGGEQTIYARREKRAIRFQSSKFSDGAVFLPCAMNTATTRTAMAASVISTI